MNSADKFVVWIDDDPNLLNAERFDLRDLGYGVVAFSNAGTALDWLVDNQEKRALAHAIIVDALMPSYDDNRFISRDDLPAGLLLCRELSTLPDWSSLRPKCVLYTRLPGGVRLERVKAQAQGMELFFCRKSRSSRIAVELLKQGIIY